MSRLLDKFQNAAKASVQPMGFRTSKTAPPVPGFLLIASTAPDVLKDHSEIAGADAVLLLAKGEVPAAKYIGKIIDSVGETPVGLYMEDADDEDIAALTEAGCDFFVFTASSRYVAAPPEEKKPGRILEIESSMDDSLLRAVNALPVDAFIAADTFKGGALSWHELMIFQHLANTFGKPLIINLPPDATEAEIKALYEAGIDGAVVDANSLEDGGLKKLQEVIRKLPAKSARKRGKVDVLLPRLGGTAPSEPPPDEEEEEEDE